MIPIKTAENTIKVTVEALHACTKGFGKLLNKLVKTNFENAAQSPCCPAFCFYVDLRSESQTPGKIFFDRLNDLLQKCTQFDEESTHKQICADIGASTVQLYSNTNYVEQDGKCVEPDFIKEFYVLAAEKLEEAHQAMKIKVGAKESECFRQSANAFKLLVKVYYLNGPHRIIPETDKYFIRAEAKSSINYPFSDNVKIFMQTQKDDLEESHQIFLDKHFNAQREGQQTFPPFADDSDGDYTYRIQKYNEELNQMKRDSENQNQLEFNQEYAAVHEKKELVVKKQQLLRKQAQEM